VLRHIAALPALLVALSLTGAPAVLSRHAPVEKHRCSCRSKAGEAHRCACGLCQRAALAARAADGAAPPCHRAAAREALDDAQRSRRQTEPCVEGSCGPPGRGAPAVAGLDPFCLPRPPALAARLLELRVEVRLALLHGREPAPESPPPIHAA